jgi:hypothetical protein
MIFFIDLETFLIVSCSNRDTSPRDLAIMTFLMRVLCFNQSPGNKHVDLSKSLYLLLILGGQTEVGKPETMQGMR